MKTKKIVITLLMLLLVFGSLYYPSFNTEVNAQVVEDYDDLIKEVTAKGSIRVIVKLKGDFKPDSELNSENSIIQQKKIQASQDELIKFLSLNLEGNANKFKYTPYIVLTLNLEGVKNLLVSSKYDSIEKNELYTLSLMESIPLIGGDKTGSFDGFTGAGQTIAILDSGVDKSHPFLLNKVVDEACYSRVIDSTHETSICPNGKDEQVGPNSGTYCRFRLDQVCDHGTHLAGIAAGKDPGGTNSTGFSGVAKDATIISIQVGVKYTYIDKSDTSCGVTGSPCIKISKENSLKGLEKIYELRTKYRIAAVNMSFGGDEYLNRQNCDSANGSVKDLVDNLRKVGIATISSSGNDGLIDKIGAPACISSVISVGATVSAGTAETVWTGSNSYSQLDLLAPGVSIMSSIIYLPGLYPYSERTGTSSAVSFVAGAFAVMRSKLPSLSVDDIKGYLQISGDKITDARNGVTTPRIQLTNALRAINCPQPYNATGDMHVTYSCTFYNFNDLITPSQIIRVNYLQGNLYVENNSIMTVAPTASFKLNLKFYKVLVQKGSSINVKKGGKLSSY